MVFNIMMDNTDDHEENHALLVVNNVMTLAPAFDVLPASPALGYQSMRVGQEGGASTLENALSEQDVAVLAQTIDRPFLRSQRMAWL
jgi:serine/threonine-protein kinase HipA